MSAQQTKIALSQEDIEMIEEYEKMESFSEDVLAGKNSPSNDNASLQSPQTVIPTTSAPGAALPTGLRVSRPTPRAAPAIQIDYLANYYKDLGVEAHVGENAIGRAFRHKVDQFGPKTTAGKNKRKAGGRTRRRAEEFYIRAIKAHQILSNSRLRKQYDEGRITVSAPVAASVPPIAAATATAPVPPATSTTPSGPGAPLYGPMGTISWENKAKAADREGKQIENVDDGAVSDTDSIMGLYWGAKGRR